MIMERIYTIPLRKAFRKPRTKRGPVAIRLIRSFLARHMKIDEEKIKIGSTLNESVWVRGISRPPRRVKVNAVLDEGGILKVELVGHKYKEFKAVKKAEKEGMKEKLMKRLGAKAIKKQEEEKLVEGKKSEEEKQIVEVSEKAGKKDTEETKPAIKEGPAESEKEETKLDTTTKEPLVKEKPNEELPEQEDKIN